MAIIHVDFINGDDANDGSTWALAQKTLPVGYSPDQYKLAKTPINTLQLTGVWDEDLNHVKIEGGSKLLHHSGNSGCWIKNGSYSNYTASPRKVGASSYGMNINLQSNYPLGKVGYLPLPAPVSPIGFNRLSYYFITSLAPTTQDFDARICLCADGLGEVIVKSFPLVLNSIGNRIFYFLQDLDGLTTDINSMAIYIDRKTISSSSFGVAFNNIVFCNDNLHCDTLISPSSDYHKYRAIKYMEDDKFFFEDGKTNVAEPQYYTYGDDSITTSVKTIKPYLYTASGSTAAFTPKSVIGGYNILTDDVDGITNIDGFFGTQNGFTIPTKNFPVKNIALSRFSAALRTFSNAVVDNCYAYSCDYFNAPYGGNPSYPVFKNCYGYGLFSGFFNGSSLGLWIENCFIVNSLRFVMGVFSDFCFKNNIAKNSSLFSIDSLQGAFIKGCSSTGLKYMSKISGGDAVFMTECDFDNEIPVSTQSYAHTFTHMTNSTIIGCNFKAPVVGTGTHMINCTFPTSAEGRTNLNVSCDNFNNEIGNNGTFLQTRSMVTKLSGWQTEIKPTEESLGAWFYIIPSYGDLLRNPAPIRMLEFAASAGSIVKVKIWVALCKVSQNGLQYTLQDILTNYALKLFIPKNTGNGITEDIMFIKPEEANWNQIEVTFISINDSVYTIYAVAPDLVSIVGTLAILIGEVEINEY